VTLHLTIQAGKRLEMHHFSSASHPSTKGLAPIKFAEACRALVSSAHVAPLNSTGLDLYRDWDARGHNPTLGAAKKASLQHHIELLSRII
jgi:hypothetical protein